MKNCCDRIKKRDEEELTKLNNRLKRIEGQVRGVGRMLNEDAYCTDILTQVSAIQSALNAFNQELLISHINTCVVEDIRNGNDEVVTDLAKTIKKLMK